MPSLCNCSSCSRSSRTRRWSSRASRIAPSRRYRPTASARRRRVDSRSPVRPRPRRGDLWSVDCPCRRCVANRRCRRTTRRGPADRRSAETHRRFLRVGTPHRDRRRCRRDGSPGPSRPARSGPERARPRDRITRVQDLPLLGGSAAGATGPERGRVAGRACHGTGGRAPRRARGRPRDEGRSRRRDRRRAPAGRRCASGPGRAASRRPKDPGRKPRAQ